MSDMNDTALHGAAELIDAADALVVAAGAGIGVDSGLPDFRGPGGFWRAYPALGRRGLAFHEVASPRTFASDPALAWGFYGHRLGLYRHTSPHAGFAILKAWGERMADGCRVFTSNVDGQFQRAGFSEDAVTECHGSIHHLQCSRPCCGEIWSAERFAPSVDEATCTLINELPTCSRCGAVARPNILMFNDGEWIDTRARRQEAGLHAWLGKATRIVVIELGAGTAIPSVRHFSDDLLLNYGARLVRVNTLESAVPTVQDVAIAESALAGLMGIQAKFDADASPMGALSGTFL
jgi:NAD-dependent SIR2 family protein deacetylase